MKGENVCIFDCKEIIRMTLVLLVGGQVNAKR